MTKLRTANFFKHSNMTLRTFQSKTFDHKIIPVRIRIYYVAKKMASFLASLYSNFILSGPNSSVCTTA